MFTSEYFMFDNIPSTDFGLYLVKMDTNMFDSPFGIKRDLIEEQVNGVPVPYLFGTKQQPLTLTLTLAREKEWDFETRRKVVQWLFQDDYKPLISSDNPSIVYYCMATGDARRFNNGNDEGYIKIDMRCNAPYGFNYPISTQTFDLSDNTGTKTIILQNLSNIDKYYYPEIEIEMKGSTDIILKNLTDGGSEFKFTGLINDETIYVNNQRKQIISSKGLYRHDKFGKVWLRLLRGENQIQVTGQCIIKTKMQYPIAL